MIELFYKLSGGRPMTVIDNHVFIDIVSGETVKRYTDHFNRNWLATHAWSMFRVAVND